MSNRSNKRSMGIARSVLTSLLVAGMLGGLGVTVYYMLVNAAAFRSLVGLPAGSELWFAIHPVSAGVFGVPAGFATALAVSLLARRH